MKAIDIVGRVAYAALGFMICFFLFNEGISVTCGL
jgi:hypothetical protein